MGECKMKKIAGILLLLTLSLFGFGTPLQAAESASPYDTTLEIGKNTNSAVDGFIDSFKTIDKKLAGKLADFLKNTSIWQKLSGKAQDFLKNNIGKLGPLAKKLGWIANAIDLAPSVYNLVTSIANKDRNTFRTAFRDTALKSLGIVVGIGIGAGVTAALPAVAAAVAATGGTALLVLAAGGAVVTVGGGMLADRIAKSWLSKPLERFADKLYNKLINNTSGPSISPGGNDDRSGGGPVKLNQLRW